MIDLDKISRSKHVLLDDSKMEYWSARQLKDMLDYTEWRNFEGVIKRAIGLIHNQARPGLILKTTMSIAMPKTATKTIVDYILDEAALELLIELCSSFKLNNCYSIRNESVVLQMVEKWCVKHRVSFEHQHRLDGFVFDCMVGNLVLIEFDEPHHATSPRQRQIDMEKNTVANLAGYYLFRVDLEMDVVDIITYLEEQL